VPARYVIWLHHDDGRTHAPPGRVARYLRRHEQTLRSRSGTSAHDVPGSLFRVTAATLAPKVVWHDLSETLNAVALPARARTALGCEQSIVPLNTVYFVPIEDEDAGFILAAYFNSLPVRCFARAIAERDKDARFRFFAWTIGVIPLPAGWMNGRVGRRVLALSRAAHDVGAIAPDAQDELDELIASAYGLSTADRQALARYDRWLRGVA
jgi:hypothetical protein